MLLGQIVSAMALSHFGWLGSPKEPLSLKSLVGAAVMFAGVVLATW
jgi:transporter family-2 protein